MSCQYCGGEGFVEIQVGYRYTGSGYGDVEPNWDTEPCGHCRGSDETQEDEE